MLHCHTCGGTDFADREILWDALVEAWELSEEERSYIDRQQGTHCVKCGCSLRSIVLAKAIVEVVGVSGPLRAAVRDPGVASLDVLEINEAGSLGQFLGDHPKRTLSLYPAVDMQALPYPDASYDLVLHSDTLEHVPDANLALRECRRVLRPNGAMCFTVPIIVGRMTRSTAGRVPSYHGSPAQAGEDFRVHTEFGADAWTWCLRAGFDAVTITAIEYPTALALTAWRGAPMPLTAELEWRRLRDELDMLRNGRSWRIMSVLRRLNSVLR